LGERLRRCRVGLNRPLGPRRGKVQELARRRDHLGAIAIGEQAILGRTWMRKADDVERHRGVAAGAIHPAVFDLEGDSPLVDCDQAVV
jgi:hypothetical protein